MQVVFTDADGQKYNIELYVGTWYRILRGEDYGATQASFGSGDPNLLSWTGKGCA